MAGEIELIHTTQAAAAGGHYAQAVLHQGVLYVSGQLPIRTDGSHSVDQPFEVQAAIALDNLMAILGAAGRSPSDLLKVRSMSPASNTGRLSTGSTPAISANTGLRARWCPSPPCTMGT